MFAGRTRRQAGWQGVPAQRLTSLTAVVGLAMLGWPVTAAVSSGGEVPSARQEPGKSLQPSANPVPAVLALGCVPAWCSIVTVSNRHCETAPFRCSGCRQSKEKLTIGLR